MMDPHNNWNLVLIFTNYVFLIFLQKNIKKKKRKDQKVEVDQVLQNGKRDVKGLIHVVVEIGMLFYYKIYLHGDYL